MNKVMICDRSEVRLEIAGKLGFAVCNNLKEDFEKRASLTNLPLICLKPQFGRRRTRSIRGMLSSKWHKIHRRTVMKNRSAVFFYLKFNDATESLKTILPLTCTIPMASEGVFILERRASTAMADIFSVLTSKVVMLGIVMLL